MQPQRKQWYTATILLNFSQTKIQYQKWLLSFQLTQGPIIL